MVGIGGEYTPDFVGSKNGKLMPIPIFSIRRAGSIDQFRGPRDSASIALLDLGIFAPGRRSSMSLRARATNTSS